MLIALCNNLGVTVLQTWVCNNKNRSAGGSDDWHEGNVGVPPSLWAGLTLTCQASLSCGFPSSVQEVLRLDIRLDSVSEDMHTKKRGDIIMAKN